MVDEDRYTFEISLSVLNHLGRNLYRSFMTVLGEAISNSWDADAENVWIFIDRDKNSLVISDDGEGMNSHEFQTKFLKIGYSKRKDGVTKTKKGRPFIGRKGIGKLALLSCADKISILTRKDGQEEYVGGTIDNSGLSEAIQDDLTPEKYSLEKPDLDTFAEFTKDHNQGTILYFENINEGIRNRIEYLKKLIALHFRFSLLDPDFQIHVNSDPITIDHLDDLSNRTQFAWVVNDLDDPYVNAKLIGNESLKFNDVLASDLNIRGFIASVEKPRHLKVISTKEKASVDLLVNGRLREKNLLKHIPTARIVENYLYGQIHYDGLDSEIDRFTSSREGIISDDEKFNDFLEDLKVILSKVVDDWDEWRIKIRKDGDPENPRITKKERKSRELYNAVSQEYLLPDGSEQKGVVNDWVQELEEDAQFNFGSYAECFVAENLLRTQIEYIGIKPSNCINIDPNGNSCIDRNNDYSGLCEYCKGEKGKSALQQQKSEAGTSILIRNSEDDLLMYLNYIDLAKIIDDQILRHEDKIYRPLRNSIMHAARLTVEAKTRLTSVLDNIIATVKKIISNQE